ncbi:Ras-related protein Rab-24, partial [Nibea albiflora]
DLTDSSSFQRARFWVKELQNCEEHCKIYLCATKNDLVEGDRSLRQIDYHDAQDFAEEIGAQHFETSSKTGNNVDELFQKVAEDYNSTAFQYMTEDLCPELIPSKYNILNMKSLPLFQQRKRASTWARRKTHISTPVAITTDAEQQEGNRNGHFSLGWSKTWICWMGAVELGSKKKK